MNVRMRSCTLPPKLQVPKLHVLNLTFGYFGGVFFPYKKEYPYSLSEDSSISGTNEMFGDLMDRFSGPSFNFQVEFRGMYIRNRQCQHHHHQHHHEYHYHHHRHDDVYDVASGLKSPVRMTSFFTSRIAWMRTTSAKFRTWDPLTFNGCRVRGISLHLPQKAVNCRQILS